MNGTHYIEPVGKKIYKALLSQSGTDNPTAIVLENTLGEVPVLSRSSEGNYTITSANNLFVEGKTFITLSNVFSNYSAIVLVNHIDDAPNIIYITTHAIDTFLTIDNILNNTPIVIEVYP